MLDVGTGSGQVAASAANHFERVHATDVSEAQLVEAPIVHGVTHATERLSAVRSRPEWMRWSAERSTGSTCHSSTAKCASLPTGRNPRIVQLRGRTGGRAGAAGRDSAVHSRRAGPMVERPAAVVEAVIAHQAALFEERPPRLSASTVGDLERFEDPLRTWSAAS